MNRDVSDAKLYWDGVAPVYDTLYSRRWSSIEDGLTQKILLNEVVTRKAITLLDIGCGTGLGLDLIIGSIGDFHYTGIDISEKMSAILRARYPATDVYVGDAEIVMDELHNRQFDFIMAINCSASFIINTHGLLDRVSRRLKGDGRYYLSFLNRYSLRRILKMDFQEREDYRTRGDKSGKLAVQASTMTRGRFTTLARSSGLSVDKVSYQSTLGGVWESDASIVLERPISKLLPMLGHSIGFCGGRLNEKV